MDQIIIVLIAAIAGVGTRTLVPYLIKIKNGEITSFDARFVATMLLALIVSLFVAINFVVQFQIPEGMPQNLLVLTVLSQSYVFNDIANEALTSTPKPTS